MGGFDVRAKTLPTVAEGLLHAAIVLLNELHNQRGPGAWVDNLHGVIVRHIKNQVLEGMSPAAEIEQVEAALVAIDALFSTVSSKYIRRDPS